MHTLNDTRTVVLVGLAHVDLYHSHDMAMRILWPLRRVRTLVWRENLVCYCINDADSLQERESCLLLALRTDGV